MKDGIPGLAEAPRSGRKPAIAARIRSEIITEATSPPPGRTQWSSRTMAKAKGVSPNTVQRLWRANDIKPHITRTFKISNDKNFEVKFWDVIGLYLDPPERSLVLCCDEKSQCQALERTQPGLPLGPHRVRTGTHDYIRHGTEPHPTLELPLRRKLAFDRDNETAIYNTLPDNLDRWLRQHPLQIPAAMIGGSRSRELRQIGMHTPRRITQGRIYLLEGGTHLFPLEQPDQTASLVSHALAELLPASAASR